MQSSVGYLYCIDSERYRETLVRYARNYIKGHVTSLYFENLPMVEHYRQQFVDDLMARYYDGLVTTRKYFENAAWVYEQKMNADMYQIGEKIWKESLPNDSPFLKEDASVKYTHGYHIPAVAIYKRWEQDHEMI